MARMLYSFLNATQVAELYVMASGTPWRCEVIRRETASEYFIWS